MIQFFENKHKTISNIWFFILCISVVIVTATLFWGSFRGFEITDESVYMLQYKNPELYPLTTPSGYDNFINVLTGWANLHIWHYRIINIILSILGGIVFYFGFWNFLKTFFSVEKNRNNLWNAKTVLLFIILGNFVTCFTFPRVVGYNSLTNFFLLCSLSNFLLFISREHKQEKSSFFIFLAGFLAGINIVFKFPPSILLLIIYLVCFSLLKSNFKNYLYLLTGAIAGLSLYFIFIQSPAEFFDKFFAALSAFKSSSHKPMAVLTVYFLTTLLNLFFIFKNFGYIFLILIVSLFYLNKQPVSEPKENAQCKILNHWPFLLCYLLLFITLGVKKLLAPEYIILYSVGFFTILIFQIIFTFFHLKPKSLRKEVLITAIILFFTPCLMAFGSNTPITIFTYWHICGWFALFIFLFFMSEKKHIIPFTLNKFIMPSLMVVLVLSHLFFVYINTPWRINTNLLEQKYEVKNIPRLKNIKVDITTKTYLENLKQLLAKASFKEGDYLFIMENPGIVYLFEGKLPGKTSFHFGKALPEENMKNFSNSYFLLPKHCNREICEVLIKNNVLKNHTLVGEVNNPYLPLKSKHPNTPLVLFKPTNDKNIVDK